LPLPPTLKRRSAGGPPPMARPVALFRNRKFADSPLEGDGFELSLEIRPQENCGFRGFAISTIVPQTRTK
jgi:hypothetical protein